MSSKPLLLTIDDEASIRSSLMAFFEDCGYEVIESSNGYEGMELIRCKRPDIVITDLRMPGMDGIEVVDAVKEFDDNLPIIILSGTGVITDAIEALRRGAWDYITKPIQNLIELELIIERNLERARLIKQNRDYHDNLEQLITERTEQLSKLITAVEQSANSVIITDAQGIIEYVNPKFSEVTGYTREDVIGKKPQILKSGKQPEQIYSELWQTISSGKEWRGELCNKTKTGSLFWELCSIAPIKDISGKITSFVGIKEDITERKRYEAELFYKANHDELTGLYNRYYMQSHLELQLEVLNKENKSLSLMLLDIDSLKFVNDTFGHKFGDLLLKEVADRLRHICGPEHLIARFLGDEFVIIPPLYTVAVDMTIQAEMVRNAINSVFSFNGVEVVASVSIGIVTYPEDGECVESLLKNAETTMFQAKKNGKNSIAYFTREMCTLSQKRLLLETRLHQALERSEFSLNYQPQFNPSSGTIIGMEALLRWTPDGIEPVSPVQFIPILEEIGLIIKVGEWVLWHACSQCVEWQRNGLPPLRISVNISALQFMRSDLDITVKRVLDTTGLDPQLLCLELTESTIILDSERTLEKMADLINTGIRLSLDDFGTGYSSLEYLGRMPINELKIDRSFITRMLKTHNDAAVVNTIIAMGHGLEMELVAEGVETEEQLQYLIHRNCEIIQGYLISRPLDAVGFERFIKEWPQAKTRAHSTVKGS
jgi:diguanylate cyclase (GGDEF)-like protein/PAS domain S-box-containing protein